MSWRGGQRNTCSHGKQEYYTCPELAEKVVEIALQRAIRGALFLDVGVGSGRIYSLLPEPKLGVEVSDAFSTKWEGVNYGVNFLDWKPEVQNEDVVVVSNPPFGEVIRFMNLCCSLQCKSLTVVCIVGLNIRLWSNEDKIHPFLHLKEEWITPPHWSFFDVGSKKVAVRTAVQVWERKSSERKLWKFCSFSKRDTLKRDDTASLFVTRMNSLKQVGRAGSLGRDVFIRDGRVNLTDAGLKQVSDSQFTKSKTLGTILKKEGTAIGIRSLVLEDKDLLHLIHARRREGVFADLLRFRNSSSGYVTISIWILESIISTEWMLLKRPIKFLDNVQRFPHQW